MIFAPLAGASSFSPPLRGLKAAKLRVWRVVRVV